VKRTPSSYLAGMRALVLAPLLSLTLAAPASASVEDAVRWAVSQNGLHEIGTSNRGPKIDRWERAMGLSIGRPWCGAFVHQAFLHGGIRLSPRLINPAKSLRDARARRRGLHAIKVSSVRRGDILFFAFSRGKLASHEAIVRSVKGGYAYTVEGNVSHMVQLKVRGLQYPVGAARVSG